MYHGDIAGKNITRVLVVEINFHSPNEPNNTLEQRQSCKTHFGIYRTIYECQFLMAENA